MTILYSINGGLTGKLPGLVIEEKPEKQKRCKTCGVTKPHSKFGFSNASPSDTRKGYPTTNCKECMALSAEQLKKLKIIHGYRPQIGHQCYICDREEANIPIIGFHKHCWCLDHTHQFPFEFRGWLCHTCNKGLGFFNDDPFSFVRGAMYIEKRGRTIEELRVRMMEIFDIEFEKVRQHDGL